MTLFDDLVADVDATLTRPLTEPLVVRFDLETWWWLLQEFHQATKNLWTDPSKLVAYDDPIHLISPWGVVYLKPEDVKPEGL